MIQNFYVVMIIGSMLLFLIVKNKNNRNRLMVLYSLYFYHLFFALVYYQMSFSNNADSIQYYFDVANNLDNYDFHFSYGTYFIKNITYIFIKYLNMSYLNITLLFASFSFLGYYMLFNMINPKNIKLSKYLILIFFLFNIHFWTVGIGKDSFIFFPLVLLLYSVEHKKILGISMSIFLVFLVRPHIAFLIIVSLGLLSLFFSKIKFYKKIIIISIIILTVMSTLSLLLQYVGLNEIDPVVIGEYVEKRQSSNMQGGSSINIAEYNFIMKIFAFLYRPFFESGSILSIIVSIENLIYLGMSLYIIKYRKYLNHSYVATFSIIFIIIFTLLMSNITSNLGIAVRQKTMMLAMFFYLFAIVIQKKRRITYAK